MAISIRKEEEYGNFIFIYVSEKKIFKNCVNKTGVAVCGVNPAYTSQLSKIQYMKPLLISLGAIEVNFKMSI